jgi:hypothetical protein
LTIPILLCFNTDVTIALSPSPTCLVFFLFYRQCKYIEFIQPCKKLQKQLLNLLKRAETIIVPINLYCLLLFTLLNQVPGDCYLCTRQLGSTKEIDINNGHSDKSCFPDDKSPWITTFLGRQLLISLVLLLHYALLDDSFPFNTRTNE